MSDPTELEPNPSTEDADEILAAISDEEWREEHERLRDLGVPGEQLAYTWAPGKTPEELGLQ